MASVVLEAGGEGVAVLRLNRPEKLNALDAPAFEALLAAFEQADNDPACRAVIVTGAGRAFCAGLDLTTLAPNGRIATSLGGPARLMTGMRRGWSRLIPRLRAMRPALIAAVNGPAIGGGFALSLGCDVRIACEEATFQDAFAKVGVSGCELGVGWLLPRMIGLPRALELAVTGRPIDAAEAKAIGLVHDVVQAGALMACALAKAQEIAANPPFSVWMTRETMWSALEVPSLAAAIDLENRTQALCLATDDAREQLNARLRRREPVYRNH